MTCLKSPAAALYAPLILAPCITMWEGDPAWEISAQITPSQNPDPRTYRGYQPPGAFQAPVCCALAYCLVLPTCVQLQQAPLTHDALGVKQAVAAPCGRLME